jgi:hypothetical protein
MIFADQHRLDAGRAKFDAQDGFLAFNCFLHFLRIRAHAILLLITFLEQCALLCVSPEFI